MLTIAEAVCLLELPAEGDIRHLDAARVSAALLCELDALQALEYSAGSLVATGSSVGHPVLAATLRYVGDDPRPALEWLSELPKRLQPWPLAVVGPLVDSGALTEQRTRRWFRSQLELPTVDPDPERRLRSHLRGILLGREQPGTSDAVLLGLVSTGTIDGLVTSADRITARNRAATLGDEACAEGTLAGLYRGALNG